MEKLARYLRRFWNANLNGKGRRVDFQALAENLNDLVLQVSPDGQLQYVSPSVTRMLGWTIDEVLQLQDNLIDARQMPAIVEARQKLLAGDPENETIVFRMLAKDGGYRWMEGTARRVAAPDMNGRRDIIISMRDITDRKKMEEQLNVLAHCDGLTGLANRRAFDEALRRQWEDALQNATYLSLLLIDLDHFKGLNDHYGHQVGDDCLRSVAAIISRETNHSGGLAARYGGEEIAVILPNSTIEGAVEFAETLRRKIVELSIPNRSNAEGEYKVTASIGVATGLSQAGGTMEMPQGLLLAADTALYKAKNAGRNRVESTILLLPEKKR